MGRSTVDLVEHSPRWAEEFQAERRRLVSVFGTTARAIEHVGSTAVPGLVAKPTIDIAVALDDMTVLRGRVAELEALGYELRPQAAMHGRHQFLRRIEGDERTHHLHVVQVPVPNWDEWIALRDYLRSEPDAAHRYGVEKRRLAELYHSDRNRYVEAKTPIIQQLLGEALAPPGGWQAHPTVLQLMGPPAAGKLTVAKALVARLNRGVVLMDNHSVSNPFLALVGQDGVTPLPGQIWSYVGRAKALVLEAAEALTPPEWSFVFTNYLTQDDADQRAFRAMEAFADRRGAVMVPVVLECPAAELARRVGSEERRAHSKLTDPGLLATLLDRPSFVPDHANLITVPTDKVAPTGAATLILQHAAGCSRT